MTNCCVIMAGGTGGHVFPGIAVARQLLALGWQVHWVGNPDKIEARVVPAQGIHFHSVPLMGLRKRGVLAKVTSLYSTLCAIFTIMRLFRHIRPRFVLGFGGYVSAPGGVAAKLLQVPLIIHEQNAIAGMANRWLGRIAKAVLLGFPSARSDFPSSADCEVVGNPVRQEISGVQSKIPTQDRLNVLIVGGSLGAKVFNDALPNLLHTLARAEIWHQTGAADVQDVSQHYQRLGVSARVDAFIDSMQDAYDWADVVICRAGALTVAELAAAGKPAIFVPYPHAVDDHQRKNAEYMVNQGAAAMILQDRLGQELLPLLTLWQAQPQTRAEMANLAKKSSYLHATTRVVERCLALVGE